MAADICPACGNEIAPYMNGRCYRCQRIAHEQRRFGSTRPARTQDTALAAKRRRARSESSPAPYKSQRRIEGRRRADPRPAQAPPPAPAAVPSGREAKPMNRIKLATILAAGPGAIVEMSGQLARAEIVLDGSGVGRCGAPSL